MKEVVKLMDYRPDIKIVDATLRDGGLVNNFRFTDEFVKDLYQTNIKAGVDVMEFGYKADKEMFDVKDFGKWKFCDDEDIRAVVGDNNTDLKIAVMADVGRCNYKQDIKPRAESPVDVIRVATYINQIPAAVDVIEDAVAKGYEVTCNIMAISNAQEADIRVALDLLGKSPVNVIYIVDSFGALFPEQIARIAALYGEYAAKYGKKLGIHAHNNQQLAFANTVEAVGDGLKNPKYNLYPAVQFIEKHMTKLKEDGVVWGYDMQYLLTGMLNQHPRTAIQFTKDKRKDFSTFYKEITSQE